MAPSLPTLCLNGKLEEVRAALARGEEVDQRGAGGYTGLMMAAFSGHEAVVDLLLQQPGLDVNLVSGLDRGTALHVACRGERAGILRKLLAHPSLTCHNAVDNAGSPLMLAVKKNNVELVRELVAVKGVRLETRDRRGGSLEEKARRWGSLEAWQVVREERGRREERRKNMY